MTTTQGDRRSYAAPALSAEGLAALPKRRPFLLCLLAPVIVGFGAFVLQFFFYPDALARGSAGENGRAIAFGLVPWLLTLPWLRYLDLRRVPWFFLSLGFGEFAGPVLLSIVTYRALTLPYRDWDAGWWHPHRARSIPGRNAWVLLPEDKAGPPRLTSREQRWEPVERWSWVAVMAAAVALFTWEQSVAPWMALTWFICMVVLAFAARWGPALIRISGGRPSATSGPGAP